MAADNLEKIYSKFPSLVAQNLKCTKFSWLRRLGNSSFIINFECPKFPASKNISITGDETFLFILESSNIDAKSFLESTSSLEDVLDNVNKALESLKKKHGLEESHVQIESLNAVEEICEELNKIGADRLKDIDESMTRITLTSPDYEEDKQELTLYLTPDYPKTPATVSHLLPDCWAPPVASLSQVFSSWVSAIQFYSASWRQLSDLDRLCWVLDPVPPTPAQLFRRLVITTSVSLHLELDPAFPTAIPVMKFLGSDQKIIPIREQLAENTEHWDEEEPLLTNLERVLGLELPSRAEVSAASQAGEWSLECGICYSYKLGDTEQLPSVSCEQEKCCQTFHQACLHEWLVQLPDTRTSLNMVTGECPYCSKPIQCAKPALT